MKMANRKILLVGAILFACGSLFSLAAKAKANDIYSPVLPPEIIIYPKTYDNGSGIFYLEGRAAPNAIVYICFGKENYLRQWEAPSDIYGNWSFSANEFFEEGFYNLYFSAKNEKGILSESTDKYEVRVFEKGLSFLNYRVSYEKLVITLFFFSFFLIFLLLYAYCKPKKDKKRLANGSKKAKSAENKPTVKESFVDLREKISKRIEYLDSKPGLSPREQKIKNEPNKFLNKSEKLVEKEINDIIDNIK